MSSYFIPERILPYMTGKKKIKELEGEFTIKPDEPTFPKGRKLTPRELADVRRLARVTERFAEADFDPERGTDDLFLGKDDKCVLVGIRCDNQGPCLECKIGCSATGQIKYMIDVNLGILH